MHNSFGTWPADVSGVVASAFLVYTGRVLRNYGWMGALGVELIVNPAFALGGLIFRNNTSKYLTQEYPDEAVDSPHSLIPSC